MRDGLTRRPRSLHCWQLRWAALWSLWSPVYELQRRNKRENSVTLQTSSQSHKTQQTTVSHTHTHTPGLGSDSPESLLLIVNLISDLEGNLLHATYSTRSNRFHSDSRVVSPQTNPRSHIHLFSKLKHPVLLVFPSPPIHHPSYLVCMWGSSGSSRYSCPSPLDEIYCVLLPSLPPDTERKA